MLDAMWSVLLELAPWLLLGMAVAGVLHAVLPVDFARRWLQGRGGVGRAVLLGVPLPLCSCGVIPAGLGLRRDGASNGASVGFLISTPQTGVDSILVSASFLGWPFALFKVASAAITGLVGGWLTDRVEPVGQDVATDEGDEVTNARGLRDAFEHAIQIVRTIWVWIAVGVIASAAIEVLVPPSFFASVAVHGSLVAALAVLVVSLPLYVCATASVPIAAAMVAGGLPAGAALVFLMAGPATNLATVGAVHRTFGVRILAVYLLTLIVGSVGLGVAFDFLLEATPSISMADHVHTTWWAQASALVLLAMVAAFASSDAWRWIRSTRAAGHSDGAERTVPIGGMTCDGCIRKLESALHTTEGVTSAVVTRSPDQARVRGPIDEAHLQQAIEAAGFTIG